MGPPLRETVWRGFRSLGDFRSRDSRAEFWPYAGAVLVSWFVLSNAILVPVMLLQATLGTGDPQEMERVMLGVVAVGASGVMILLAAATVRRLHDRGHGGVWAAIPALLLVSGIVIFGALSVAGDEPSAGLFIAGFANNLLYFAALIALIVQLVQPGKPEAGSGDPD